MEVRDRSRICRLAVSLRPKFLAVDAINLMNTAMPRKGKEVDATSMVFVDFDALHLSC